MFFRVPPTCWLTRSRRPAPKAALSTPVAHHAAGATSEREGAPSAGARSRRGGRTGAKGGLAGPPAAPRRRLKPRPAQGQAACLATAGGSSQDCYHPLDRWSESRRMGVIRRQAFAAG